eukprot:TRINITY_DN40990_c0_g1_i1.p1 TRINITY_DN40990_c0_g1~~TRINITY_DN40990_c0_g1_i1.p1  ORF type:complete len:498 (+),score=68.13 TRINITY_DN40990_c0_g1_i1:96-1589(+)
MERRESSEGRGDFEAGRALAASSAGRVRSRSRSCRRRDYRQTRRRTASADGSCERHRPASLHYRTAAPSGRRQQRGSSRCRSPGASAWQPRRREQSSRDRPAASSPRLEERCRRGGSADLRSAGRDQRPRALFLMGLPGAGKTTVKRRRLRKGDVDIEPDQFKRRHPRYSEDMGDATDDEVHRWSVRRSVDAFEDIVNSPGRPDVVLDSSGSNVQWLRRRLVAAKNNGYRTEILWVDVPLEIALLRNRDRAARRGDRTMVPDKVIMDKVQAVKDSFAELSGEADFAERVQNWSEDSGELRRAKDDLYFYPPPRTRPPALRAGDRGYGEMPSGARSPSPSRGSRRTMRIGPWKRGDEVMREKNRRLDWMDRTYNGNRERYVSEEVLQGREVLLEPNRYPYQLPPDVEHWTIWARRDMQHDELCEYVEGWLNAREPHNVLSWNYDDNHGRRTIDIWHVHVYFRGRNGQPPDVSRRTSKGDHKKRPTQSSSCHRLSPCSV